MIDILATIESIFQKDETFVINLIMKMKAGVAAVNSDLKACFAWIAAHITQINADVNALLNEAQVLQAAGVPMPVEMSKAIAATNVAMAAVNAFANSTNSGAGTLTTLVAGYTAAKDAEAAHAVAAAAVVAATPTVSAPAIAAA